MGCTGCLHSVWRHTGGMFIYTSAQLLSLLPVRYDRHGFAAEGNLMSAWTTKLNGRNDTGAVRWSAGHPSRAHMMESGSPGTCRGRRWQQPQALVRATPWGGARFLAPCPVPIARALPSATSQICFVILLFEQCRTRLPMMLRRIQPCKNFELARTVGWSLITNRRRQQRPRLVPT